ncbi:hypothetical protein MCEMSEM23_02801 [Rhabdaerophilaceae bacterium]
MACKNNRVAAYAWAMLACLLPVSTSLGQTAPEHRSATRAEIRFDNERSWHVTARSRLIVGQTGALPEPLQTEGFAQREVLSQTFRIVASRSQPVTGTAQPHGSELYRKPEAFGLTAGDVIEQETSFRFQPLMPNTGMDQVFLFPDREQTHEVSITVFGERPNIRLESSRLVMQRLIGADGGRTNLEATREPFFQRRGMSHALESAPRLAVSTHMDSSALGDLMPKPAPIQGLVVTRGDFEPMRLAALLMEEVRKRSATGAQPPLSIGMQRQNLRPSPRVVSEGQASALEAAILLRDLLVQHGHEADLVLANDRMFAKLPRVPVGLYDTAIVVVPAHGIVVDLSMPGPSRWFQPDFYGREILRVSSRSTQFETLPAMTAATNRILITADMMVGRDGVVEGQSITRSEGPSALLIHDMAAKLSGSRAGMMQASLLERQGLDGLIRIGAVEKRGEEIHAHLGFRLVPTGGGDNVHRISLVPGPAIHRPPLLGLILALQDTSIKRVPCRAIEIEQAFIMHLPDRRALVEMPKSVLVEHEQGRYSAQYRLEDSRLHVSRKLMLDPKTTTCSREQLLNLAPVIRAAGRDFARKIHLRLPDG